MLVAYDAPFPPPLDRLCPIAAPLGIAFVFGPGDAESGLGRFTMEFGPAVVGATLRASGDWGTPIGEVLALLGLAAHGKPGSVCLTGGEWPDLTIDYRP